MESRSKNGIRNIYTSILNQIVAILIPFVTRTILIYTLGSEYLGINNLFSSVLMLLNLSELGIGSALVYSMYKPLAENDIVAVNGLLNLYKRIYKTIGAGILVVGGALSLFLPYLIKGDIPHDINIYIVFYIYLINSAVSYFAYAHKKGLLMALQRNDYINNVNTAIKIISFVLQVIILLVSKNYYLYILVFVLGTVVDNLWTEYITRVKYSQYYCSGPIAKSIKDSIAKQVKGVAIQKIASTTRSSLGSIAVSMFLGLRCIAIYGNYFYIMSSVHSFLYQVPNSIRAVVGNSVAEESLDKNFSDFKTLFFIYNWITCVCACCLLCLYQPFMRLWMGDDMLLPFHTIMLFCVYFIIIQFGDIINLYKDAAGLWWYGRYRVIIESVSNITLCFTLGYFWGIDGILIAPILTLLTLDTIYGGCIVFRYYFVNVRYGTVVITLLAQLVVVIFVTLLTYAVSEMIEVSFIFGFILKAIVSLLLPSLLLFIIYHRTAQFNSARLFISGLINKRRV